MRADDERKTNNAADRIESIAESIVEAIDKMEVFADVLTSKGNTTTVIHKTEGMGAWGSAAVVACFLTYLSLIIFAIYIIPEVHNVKAWNEVLRGKVAKFEAQQLEKKP